MDPPIGNTENLLTFFPDGGGGGANYVIVPIIKKPSWWFVKKNHMIIKKNFLCNVVLKSSLVQAFTYGTEAVG